MSGPSPGHSHRPPATDGVAQTCTGVMQGQLPKKGRSQSRGSLKPRPQLLGEGSPPLFLTGLPISSHLSDRYPKAMAPTITPAKKKVEVALFRPFCSHTRSHCRDRQGRASHGHRPLSSWHQSLLSRPWGLLRSTLPTWYLHVR